MMLSPEVQESDAAHGHLTAFGHISQPPGTREYTVSSDDNLRSIAVAFDTTTTKLMKLNRMSSLTVFPGQMLYVPCHPDENQPLLPSLEHEDFKNTLVKFDSWDENFTGDLSFLAPLSPSASLQSERPFKDLVTVSTNSDSTQPTKFDESASSAAKRLNAFTTSKEQAAGAIDHDDVQRSTSRASERMTSAGSSESEQLEEGFLRMDAHYVIPGAHHMVNGVMLVTLTALIFEPDAEDPIAKRDGCDEYGVMCSMDKITGVAMYNDTTRMATSALFPAKSMASHADGRSSMSSDTTTEAETEIRETCCKCEGHELPTEQSLSDVTMTDQNTRLNDSDKALSGDTATVETCSTDEALQESKSTEFKLGNEFPFLQSIVKTVADLFPVFDSPKRPDSKAKSFRRDCNNMYFCVRVRQRMTKAIWMSDDDDDEKQAPELNVETRRDKNLPPEYWFKVPRKRSNQIYTFFLQWSPESETDGALGFVVMAEEPFLEELSDNEDKKKSRKNTDSSLEFVDDFYEESCSFEKEWEIISIQEARRKSVALDALKLAEEDDSLVPELEKPSNLLTDETLLSLCRHLPNCCIGYSWSPVYTTNDHGTSLRTLYRNMLDVEAPVVLLVRDSNDAVFGALCSNPLRMSDHYYGTGESFLFTLSPNFEVFKWSGENSFFIKGDTDSITIGGGKGKFGLWIDGDLYRGCSHSCDTFKNKVLSAEEDFLIHSIEVWKIKGM